MKCGECGEDYDPAYLDQVLFHNTDHKPRLATGIVGHEVTPPRTLAKPRAFGMPYGLKNTELMGVTNESIIDATPATE